MILLLGDIHGNFDKLKSQITRADITDCVIIQVGDFGIGFNKESYDKGILNNLNSFLSERNITLYAIRGNHDNPNCFDGTWVWSNLQLLKDYSILELEDWKILLIGGAVSVDRYFRKKKDFQSVIFGGKMDLTSERLVSWWSDEVVTMDRHFLENVRGVDVLITHTTPDFCHPNNRYGFGQMIEDFSLNDDNLISDLTFEREQMSEIFTILKKNNDIEKHFYGHFHRSHVEEIEGCSHRLLNIDELYELR